MFRSHTRVHPRWNSKVVAKMGQELQTVPPKNTAGTKHPEAENQTGKVWPRDASLEGLAYGSAGGVLSREKRRCVEREQTPRLSGAESVPPGSSCHLTTFPVWMGYGTLSLFRPGEARRLHSVAPGI